MRILIVDTYYQAFQDLFYAQNPDLASASYEEQLARLLAVSFGTGDAYSFHLRELGHEAREVIVDCAPLQAAWAREHGHRALAQAVHAPVPGVAGRRLRLAALRRIALEQIRDYDPDVVYSQNMAFFSRGELDKLAAEGRLVAGQIASPLPPWRLVEGFQFVATSFPHFVERLRERGVDSEYLKLAIDARIVDRLRERGVDARAEAPRADDVVFVGGVDPRIHPSGTALLEEVCAHRQVAVYGYGADALPQGSAIRRSFRGEAWGLDMYSALATAKVALNRHIDVAEGWSNNMRLYEATGMGACLVTDRGRNLAEIFEPGREVVAYDDRAQLLEEVDRLLADDDARVQIAAAGQEHALREHNFGVRMAELAAMLEPRVRRG